MSANPTPPPKDPAAVFRLDTLVRSATQNRTHQPGTGDAKLDVPIQHLYDNFAWEIDAFNFQGKPWSQSGVMRKAWWEKALHLDTAQTKILWDQVEYLLTKKYRGCMKKLKLKRQSWSKDTDAYPMFVRSDIGRELIQIWEPALQIPNTAPNTALNTAPNTAPNTASNTASNTPWAFYRVLYEICRTKNEKLVKQEQLKKRKKALLKMQRLEANGTIPKDEDSEPEQAQSGSSSPQAPPQILSSLPDVDPKTKDSQLEQAQSGPCSTETPPQTLSSLPDVAQNTEDPQLKHAQSGPSPSETQNQGMPSLPTANQNTQSSQVEQPQNGNYPSETLPPNLAPSPYYTYPNPGNSQLEQSQSDEPSLEEQAQWLSSFDDANPNTGLLLAPLNAPHDAQESHMPAYFPSYPEDPGHQNVELMLPIKNGEDEHGNWTGEM